MDPFISKSPDKPYITVINLMEKDLTQLPPPHDASNQVVQDILSELSYFFKPQEIYTMQFYKEEVSVSQRDVNISEVQLSSPTKDQNGKVYIDFLINFYDPQNPEKKMQTAKLFMGNTTAVIDRQKNYITITSGLSWQGNLTTVVFTEKQTG